MARKRISPSRQVSDALQVLGNQVRIARTERQIPMSVLAHRVGLDPRVVSAVERGDPSVSIGNAFAVACAAGVPLFGGETPEQLTQIKRHSSMVVALLPSRVRKPSLGSFL